MPRRVVIILSSVFPLAAVLAAGAPVPARIEFNRDVRPILSDNCFYCHGPDASHRKAKLRLDVREVALAKEAIVPGKPADSELVIRFHSNDPEEVMPPPDSNKKLTARDKAVLERWIAQGAGYQLHWAYEPPAKPAIPADANAIDSLVARRLAEVGLKSSPEADRRTLIRRVTSDLTGLLPTPEEVDAFEKDRAPDAYARVVDRLLASPHYGERMAIGWLDVVRFADTIGYHSDNPRNVWPYRDWVIRSFNENKRFDRFTLEQIAGDLLPDANRETRIGSAFNRLLLTTEEGGAQPKDYEARMLADRVRAIGAGWLGQTTGCAQCHDHKFDPFTTRDFYALGAFFADVKEPVIGRREEGMVIAPPEQEEKLAALDREVAAKRAAVAALTPEFDAAEAEWVSAATAQPPTGLPRAVAAALKKDPDTRTARDQQVLRNHFRTKVATIGREELAALTAAEQERKTFADSLPHCLVTEAAPKKRAVRILPRGNFLDDTGEVVTAALPGYLPRPDFGGREPNRLDLARWLVSRENPLTARVVANRLWQQFFGGGLSRVAGDFGAQGEPPRNGALLDWLAGEFMDRGWDVKHLVRTIVLSATYRQTSVATPEQLAADPENREFGRQGRHRVEAELVRDRALQVAGLLSPRVGGPSVKPYQPDRYWENLNFPPRDYEMDRGEAQYRRGLYVWWQRTFLHPAMLAFDAPSREECAAERSRANIPQQALVLLNDPSYVEAARVFAARIVHEGGATADAQLHWAGKQALQRTPSASETKTVSALLEEHRRIYRADPAAAKALLATGDAPLPAGLATDGLAELAAWTHVARVLFNLHEFVTRD
ncbi:MAG: PSD1 domain-containing protein [Verrucomicrobia bacterium]|nr:PSD1 domain-containing protein [Verrucomicrobiota bacterium]